MLVKEYMSRGPAVVSLDDDIRVVFNMLSDMRVRQAPVLENGRLVGMVTDRDLRMALVQYATEHNLSVRSIMTPNPVTVSEDASLKEAGCVLASHKFNALPVLSSKGELTGILTTMDILKGLLKVVEIPKSKGPLINK